MGKVLWHVTMSLDGFIAGPGDAMDWMFPYVVPNPVVDEIIKTTGSVLAGRRSYNVGARKGQRAEFRKVYGGAWTGPQFVLTHEAPDAPEDPTITFLSGDIRKAVATALQAAEGKDVVVIGANVAQQCIDEGLVDEILVHLAPLFARRRRPALLPLGRRPGRLGNDPGHAVRTADESPLPRRQVAPY